MKHINSLVYYAVAAVILFATAYSCSSDGSSDFSNSEGGQGGSMARFTIVGDYLYTVDHQTLHTLRLADPAKPQHLDLRDLSVGFDIETIFPYDGKLFIGSRAAMYIYDIASPEFPKLLSQVQHFSSCDPVVAAGNYAYVTLNSDNITCWRGKNELQVYDISDPKSPQLVSPPIAMKSPRGLGVDEAAKILFVCDQGVKAFDLSIPSEPEIFWDLTDVPQVKGMRGYDCIPMNGVLMVVGEDGLYQFDYTGENIEFLSKIDIRRGNHYE
ncbi:hypothetical protein LJB87_02210 [Alistipes sp. OttesenSCG-928-L06]|nr:hypothetical protein [Alistipes sp. OttesenSCG-928-L06]